MTKNAQQALKYLLQISSNNVRFCLICNYISKIDESLQSEFICVRFNQLPKKDIYKFVKNIAHMENLVLTDDAIDTIQSIYNSDIRSMINFIQLNQNLKTDEWNLKIMGSSVLEKIHSMLLENKDTLTTLLYIHEISIQYNTDKQNIILDYFNYIIRNHTDFVTVNFLKIVENVLHNHDTSFDVILEYVCLQLGKIQK